MSINSISAPKINPDEPVRFTDTERLLALQVSFLTEQVATFRHSLAAVLTAVGGRGCAEAHARLYPEDITDSEGEVLARHCQAPGDPVPSWWLRDMATTRRSLAQVAGGRDQAQEMLDSLEHGGWMKRPQLGGAA